MSENRTQTEVLYELLSEEALRASAEIAKLRDEIPAILTSGQQDLIRMGDSQVERLQVAAAQLTDKARSFEEVASRAFLGITQVQAQMDATNRQNVHRLLDEARMHLQQQAAVLAGEAAHNALEASLDPAATKAASGFLEAVEDLQFNTRAAARSFRQMGWTRALRTGAVVVVAVFGALTVDRLLDQLFPPALPADTAQLVAQGQAVSDVWPELDAKTKERINAKIAPFSASP